METIQYGRPEKYIITYFVITGSAQIDYETEWMKGSRDRRPRKAERSALRIPAEFE